MKFRGGRARAKRQNLHAGSPELVAKSLGQKQFKDFARRIRCLKRRRNISAHRSHENDATFVAPRHLSPEGVRQRQRGAAVYREQSQFSFYVMVQESSCDAEPGVVDQESNIESFSRGN